ncbi:hypothetical protein GGI16_001143 [Coemansia sp. S142-1]|nr:hypothetical protein GGI16_001143 [Coemansia sp. S142-1]
MTHLSNGALIFDDDDDDNIDFGNIELYDLVTSKWGILSERLQCCNLFTDFGANMLVTYGMLLATLCPSIKHFKVKASSKKTMDNIIKQAIKEEPFNRHAERLERITIVSETRL